MTIPLSVTTSLTNLVFHKLTLRRAKNFRVFIHHCSGFEFPYVIRHLPALVIFNPATLITGKPSTISCYGDKERNRIVHLSTPMENSVFYIVTEPRESKAITVAPRGVSEYCYRFLAYASGYQ